MALTHSPKIVTDGLVFYSDAENKKSYDPSDQNNLNKWKDAVGRSISGIFSGSSNYNNGSASTFNVTNWTSALAAEDNYWNDVTYSPSGSAGLPTEWKLLNSSSNTIDIRSNSWKDIVYGDGKWVAVSSQGSFRVMYSYDGINWTGALAAEDNSWNGVAYGNGVFVAVSGTGSKKVMYSTDGINWTGVTVDLTYWTSVTFGNGKFVAVGSKVGSHSQVMTSTDGITWTNRTAATDSDWYSITYSSTDVRFVAVASGGTGDRVMYSGTGTVWYSASAAEANQWRGVTYANGKYVAVSSDGTNRVMYSSNGFAWTAASAAEQNSWYGVTYGNGYFVAVSWIGTNKIMYSTDGINWNAQSEPTGSSLFSAVAYGNGKFIAVSTFTNENGMSKVIYSDGGLKSDRFLAVSSTGTNRIMYSVDGSSWTSALAPENNNWKSVTYGNDKFIAVSNQGTNRIMYSDDGSSWQLSPESQAQTWESIDYAPEHIVPPTTWTAATAAEQNEWKSIAYGRGIFVAVSRTGTNRVMYSSDGINWASASAAEANNWIDVTYGDGKFVAVSSDGTNQVMYSTDAITWTGVVPPISGQWYSITYGNGVFVALSWDSPTGQYQMYSTDAINWSANNTIDTNSWRDVIYADGKFVAVSYNGTNRVAYSTDGINWTAASGAVNENTGNEDGWKCIAYGNGKFVVGATTGGPRRIMYSSDAITWKMISNPPQTYGQWQGITYSNGYFVAVSDTGTNRVMYSTDGINWTAASAAEANNWQSVTYVNGKFVATSSTGTNRVMYSTSLIPNRFVAVAEDTGMIKYSDNGVTGWTTADLSNSGGHDSEKFKTVKYANGRWVCSTDGTGMLSICWSDDGIQWFNASSTPTSAYIITGFAYGNGRWVAVTDQGTYRLSYSSDGNSWFGNGLNVVNFPTSNSWKDIIFVDGKFIAISTNSTDGIAYSVDGLNWSTTASANGNQWQSLTYGSGKIVSVAGNSPQNAPNLVMYTPISTDPKKYFDFNGVNQYVQTDANSLLEIGTQDFTMSCWFRYDAVKSLQVLIDNRTAHGNGTTINLAQVGSYMRARVWEDGENAYLYESDTDLMPNVWYNFTYIMDRPNGKFYINGVLDTGTNIGYAYDYTGGNKLTLAWNYSKQSNKSLNGKMSNVLFYVGKALTESEVLQNYNALKGRYK